MSRKKNHIYKCTKQNVSLSQEKCFTPLDLALQGEQTD